MKGQQGVLVGCTNGVCLQHTVAGLLVPLLVDGHHQVVFWYIYHVKVLTDWDPLFRLQDTHVTGRRIWAGRACLVSGAACVLRV